MLKNRKHKIKKEKKVAKKKILTAEPGRECTICSAILSIYNIFDICQCHPEHPDYNPRYTSIENCGRSPSNVGMVRARRDYQGG